VTALIGAPSASPTPLTVTAVTVGEERVLVWRVAGEIDLVTVERLRKHLSKHPLGAHRGVVLDCTRVSFLTGLHPSPTSHAVVGFRFSGRLTQGPAVRAPTAATRYA
jgi:hypothetical protein